MNPREVYTAAVAALRAGRWDEAERDFRQLLAVQPEHPILLNGLGVVLASQRRHQEAIPVFRWAVQLHPTNAEVLHNLGGSLLNQGQADEAIACFRRALALGASFPAVHHNLGEALKGQRQPAEAAESYRRALALNPRFGPAWLGLGVVLAAQGLIPEAREAFHQARSLQSEDPTTQSAYLYFLNFDPETNRAELAAEHRRWGETLVRGHPLHPFTNARDPERRLRVGYLSPDFRAHPVAAFVAPLLARHDRRQVEVFAYAEVAQPDAVTERLRGLVNRWRDTVGLADERVAEMIRADGIDLLVDLAGYTLNHRLDVLARRAAPVQVSYLGYPCTTGLPTVDYRLVDAVTDPPDEAWHGTETLVRLEPVFCCYAPFSDAPPVQPTPALRNGFLTFGSLHKPEKLNDRVLDLWCRLLHAVPGSRLLLVREGLEGTTGQALLERFARRGVAAPRVACRSLRPMGARHLDAYAEIDVLLDPFPWGGHATACEALWMGVPVLTLRGDRHAGRMVASVLSCLGLNDWVSETPEEYVARAVQAAGEPEELARLREGLRERVRQSALCDAESFTRQLEAAYRGMWRQWCADAH